MIPIYVSWQHFSATVAGRSVKFVACENCSTEYVYVLEREARGGGTTMYHLNEEGARQDAQSAADETLSAVLANDFDPVPCPACGHYQRHMFPKLLETKGAGGVVLTVAVMMGACLAGIGMLYWTVNYLQSPNDYAFGRILVTGSILLALSLVGFGLSLLKKRRIRNFNPNLVNQEDRLAKARSRAITRAEYDKLKQGIQTSDDGV